jgi:hypothetical protein
VTFPEWCQITVYRLLEGQRIAFPGPRVYWLETYATAFAKSDLPNEMWKDRSRGQLEKCAEAAALRKAFPEELGADYTIDEAPRQMRNVTPADAEPAARPDRTEIERKAKAAPKADPKPEPEATVIDATPAEASEPKQDDAPPAMSERLEHALRVLQKLGLDELTGAKEALRTELSEDEFRVWIAAALERHRALEGRK